VPLPEDTGLRGDGRPKVRRFRSHRLELGECLAAFRARYGVTQAEIARAVGARDHSAVSQWESGVNVPDGMLGERLAALVEGRRWPELRTAMLADAGEGLPGSWGRAARWYRRASRERRPRETVGAAVAAIVSDLRGVTTVEMLHRHYRERDGDWAPAVVARRGRGDEGRPDLRQVEDAAYGLRWLELAHGRHLELGRSLVPQLSLALLDDAVDAR
jgi:transcriptional regulator with XRE-family HTH domain